MNTIIAFIFVFLMMPLGHAYMIVAERIGGSAEVVACVLSILTGLLLLILTRFQRSEKAQTITGAIAGILLWTGFAEYSMVFGARALGVGEMAGTSGTYRLMEHTWGFAVALFLFLLFHEGVRCELILYLRRKLRIIRGPVVSGKVTNYGPRVAFEMFAVTWIFYILLLLAYDENIFGVKSWFTYLLFVLSIGVGIYLLYLNFRYKQLGAAIRFAIPTVIVVWSGVEILAKWKVFEEPWVTLQPEVMIPIVVAFSITLYLIIRDIKQKRRERQLMKA